MPTPLLAHSNIKIHTLAPDFVMRLGAFVCIPPHPLSFKNFQTWIIFKIDIVRSNKHLCGRGGLLLPLQARETCGRSDKKRFTVRNLTVKRFLLFGLPERIRTFVLKSRSLARYPAVPRVDTCILYHNSYYISITLNKLIFLR